MAQKGYESVKKNATSAWSFLRTKFNEIQRKPTEPSNDFTP